VAKHTTGRLSRCCLYDIWANTNLRVSVLIAFAVDVWPSLWPGVFQVFVGVPQAGMCSLSSRQCVLLADPLQGEQVVQHFRVCCHAQHTTCMHCSTCKRALFQLPVLTPHRAHCGIWAAVFDCHRCVTYLGVSRTTELCAVIPSVNVCALHNSVPCCQVLACPMRRQCVPGPSTAVHCSTCTLTAKAPAPQLKQVPAVQCHAMWHAVMSSMVLLSRRHLWPCFLCSSVRPNLSLDRSANCVSLLDDACLGVQMVCTMFPKLAASCRCVVLVDSRVCVCVCTCGCGVLCCTSFVSFRLVPRSGSGRAHFYSG
jgi:hypothetical protein